MKKIIILILIILFSIVTIDLYNGNHIIKFYNYLKFLNNTEFTSSNYHQEVLSAKISGDKIKIPINVFIIKSPEEIASKRTELSIKNTFKNTSSILNQAKIEVYPNIIKEIEITKKISKEKSYATQITNSLSANNEFKDNLVNVIFIKKFSDSYFIYPSGLIINNNDLPNTTAITDRTVSKDYIILAHEIGHLLGLDDVYNPRIHGRIMSAEGMEFSLEEIEKMRENAKKYIKNK